MSTSAATSNLRNVLISCAALVLAGSGGLTSPAHAAPTSSTIYILPKLQAAAQGPLLLCPGEKLWVYVTYSETRYRVGSTVEAATQGTPEPGVEIAGTVQNPAAGRLLNATLETRSYRGLIVAPFVFEAGDVGDTTLTFATAADELTPLLPASQVRLPTDPITLDVHVGCKFQVVAFSHWFLNWGFRANANSVVEAFLVPDRNGVIPDVTTSVENVASNTVNLCANGVDVDSSEAIITSQLHVDRGTLEVTLDYGQVTGHTWVKCPAPLVGFIGALSEGNGEPVTIATRPLSITVSSSGGAQALPHVLESDMGPVNGTVSLIVVKLPS